MHLPRSRLAELRARIRVWHQPHSDALLLFLCIASSYVLFEDREFGASLFDRLPADLHLELESHFFTGVVTLVGLSLFAWRRWREATLREALSRHEAYHDVTTGILNRRGFLSELEKTCQPGRQNQVACLLFDLDGFKAVNDMHGHAAGDALLRAIPERVSALLPQAAVFARFSGDEFAVIMPIAGGVDPLDVAGKILKAVSEPFEFEGKRLEVGTSIGLAQWPRDAVDATMLLRKADLSLYKSKETGRGRVTAYNQAIDNEFRRQAVLEASLSKAIAADIIVPHYQPLVSVASGGLVGFEVLARWHDDTLGNIPPVEFIPLAVKLGLIEELSIKLMRRALTEAALWEDPLQLAFNVAPQHFTMPGFTTTLLGLIEEAGIDPRRIDIEITEESFISQPELVSDIMFTLKQYGITFSLDDFGVGYSSLGHLLNIPFDTIKIDRSFVRQGSVCPKSRALLESIVQLGHSIGSRVLVEGIETAAERDLAQKLGCDQGQGWLYGRPQRKPDFSLLNVRSMLHYRTKAML